MPTRDWDAMTEAERHEYILARLKSGSLEIIYARPRDDLFYLTIKPPKASHEEVPRHQTG